jgi:hypothetical protein
MLAILHFRGTARHRSTSITSSSQEHARRPARFASGPRVAEGLLDGMRTQCIAVYSSAPRQPGNTIEQPSNCPAKRIARSWKSPPRKQARRCGIPSE